MKIRGHPGRFGHPDIIGQERVHGAAQPLGGPMGGDAYTNPLAMGVNAGVRVEAIQLLGYIYWAVLLSGVGARRLHDTNHSGWWQLLILTGIGGLVLLVWWCQKGTPSHNRFG
jgi:uncharacterized membrane protein YhaH (DUF805 family)